VWRGFRDEFDSFIEELIKERYITEAKIYGTGILQIFLTILNPNNPDISSLLRKKKDELQRYWSTTKKIIKDVLNSVKSELGIVPKDLRDLKIFTILCLL